MVSNNSSQQDGFAAVRESNHARLLEYLQSGGDSNAVDQEFGETLLGIAAQKGDLKAGKMLLEHRADPNRASFAWPIHFAAGAGHLDFVELLLNHGSEVHCLDEDGGTPLSDAAAGGHLDIVETLLEAGADPAYRDRYGKRPILYAAEKGHREVVELLSPYASFQERRLAELRLKFAGVGRPSKEVVEFRTAAHRGDLEKVKAYIENGGDPNAFSECGSTALMMAANRGQMEVLHYLLGNGADPNLVNENGACALDYTIYKPEPEAYELLYPLTDKKLRRAAEKAKQGYLKSGQWK